MKKLYHAPEEVNGMLATLRANALQLEGHFWQAGVMTEDGEQLDRIAGALASARTLVRDIACLKHDLEMMEKAADR